MEARSGSRRRETTSSIVRAILMDNNYCDVTMTMSMKKSIFVIKSKHLRGSELRSQLVIRIIIRKNHNITGYHDNTGNVSKT